MISVLRASLRRPAPLIGSLVALTMSALIIVIASAFIGTGARATGPVDRLAGAAIVVTGSQQLTVHADGAQESVPLPDYRRLPSSLASRLGSVPGVEAAIADVSFPVALSLPGGRVLAGTAGAPLAGHSWASARLTPFRLTAGSAPSAARRDSRQRPARPAGGPAHRQPRAADRPAPAGPPGCRDRVRRAGRRRGRGLSVLLPGTGSCPLRSSWPG